MKKSVFILLGLAFFSALVVAFASSDKNKKKLESLSGTYADPNPYPYGQAFGTRVFSFDKGKWTLLFTLALDPNMNMKVFEFRTYGVQGAGAFLEGGRRLQRSIYGREKICHAQDGRRKAGTGLWLHAL